MEQSACQRVSNRCLFVKRRILITKLKNHNLLKSVYPMLVHLVCSNTWVGRDCWNKQYNIKYILHKTKCPCLCLPNRQLVLQWPLHKNVLRLYVLDYYDISFSNLWSKIIFFFFFFNSQFCVLFLGLELAVVLILLEVLRLV